MATDPSIMAGSSENNPFIFPLGDVILLTTHPTTKAPITGKVSSHALSFSSPVWKKFIFPPWDINTFPPQPKQIDCTQDNSSALLILFNIAHVQFKKVPNGKLEYHLLFEVAKLCDQYDCVELVRPWLAGWLKGEDTESLMIGNEGWLFIAWVFGREGIFETLARKLVREIMVDGNGACLLEHGKPMPEPMPPGILDSILEVRQTTIKKLLEIPYRHIRFYEGFALGSREGVSSFACYRETIAEPSEAQACDDLNHGSLLRNLIYHNLWPERATEDFKWSVKLLAKWLDEMRFSQFPDSANKHTHKDCFPKIGETVKKVLDNIKNPVLAAHINHMKVQNGE